MENEKHIAGFDGTVLRAQTTVEERLTMLGAGDALLDVYAALLGLQGESGSYSDAVRESIRDMIQLARQ